MSSILKRNVYLTTLKFEGYKTKTKPAYMNIVWVVTDTFKVKI